MHQIQIAVKANNVFDNGNGTYTLEVAGEEISNADFLTLQRLFPNLTDSAFRLLNQEILLSCVATASEINAPKKEKQDSYKEDDKRYKSKV